MSGFILTYQLNAKPMYDIFNPCQSTHDVAWHNLTQGRAKCENKGNHFPQK